MHPARQPRNPRVTGVEPEAGYTLRLTFTNGEVRRYDVKPLLDFGVFARLRDAAVFNAVTAYHGTVHWAGGAIDICPDTLYEGSVAA
ncbi:MAG: DUF2442 domain-containing protein [Verrucomicrobiales bacterium]|jgi:hypothetical protein|nr:DUF2442 domain-containing protein [Verrucomicrobiales bacterium]